MLTVLVRTRKATRIADCVALEVKEKVEVKVEVKVKVEEKRCRLKIGDCFRWPPGQ